MFFDGRREIIYHSSVKLEDSFASDAHWCRYLMAGTRFVSTKDSFVREACISMIIFSDRYDAYFQN